MELTFLKSKIHRARVTHSELNYEGSCAIDRNLLLASGIAEYEQIEIYNLSHGARVSTYAIAAEAGSGIVSMNGAAAHRSKPGELVIVCAYCRLSPDEASTHRPVLVYVDNGNRMLRTSRGMPMQAASQTVP